MGKARGIEGRLFSAEAAGPRQLFEVIGSERVTLPSSALFKVARFLRGAKRAELYLPTTWRITRNLYATPPYPAADLRREIEWASVILLPEAIALTEYVRLKGEFENLVLRGEWRQSAKLLDQFEQRRGASWLTERWRLVLLQASEGTARQVAYARRLEGTSRSELFQWIVRFASMRNEEHVSYQGYMRTIRELLARSDLEAGERAHISWHAGEELPTEAELLASVLAREATSSTFDYYEAFIAVLMVVVASGSLSGYRHVAAQAIARMGMVDDERHSNMAAALGAKRSVAHQAPYPLRDFVREPFVPATPGAEIFDDVAKALASDRVPTDAKLAGLKLALNLRPLKAAESAHGVISQHVLAAESNRALPLGLAFSSSTYSQWLTLVLPADLRFNGANALRSPPLKMIASDDLDTAISQLRDTPDLLVDVALRASLGSNSDALVSALEAAGDRVLKGDRYRALLCLCRTCPLPQEVDRFVNAAAEIALARPSLLQTGLELSAWESIRPARLDREEAIRYAICCSIVLATRDSDRLQDKIVVAVERVVRDAGTFFIDLSASTADEVNVRFLHEVLVPTNLALIEGIDSPRDGLAFRSGVLRHLMQIDPQGRRTYESELKDTAFELVLDDGMRHVDTSRLYVNLEGLMRWAQENLREDFERYRDLAETEVNEILGEESSLDGLAPSDVVLKLEKLPRTSSDDLLVKSLSSAKHAYLSHRNFGLDSFISLRVRHGSLSGTLRSAFDERNLLSLKSGAVLDTYVAPAEWLRRFDYCSPALLQDVASAFEEFTRAFQSGLDDLLHRRLRVRNAKHAMGMIDIEITEILLKGFKYDIARGADFDVVMEGIFLAYKNSVGQQLGALRSHLRGEFTVKVLLAGETLQRRIRDALGENASSAAIDAITAGMTAFGGSVAKVCGWLEVAHKDDLSQLFSLEQIVQIGVAYTKRVRSDFDPKITLSVTDSEVPLAGRSLVVLVDALFILLDNVYAHAGEPNSRAISVAAKMEEDCISLVVVNDLSASVAPDTVEAALAKAGTELANIESDAHLDEVNSGLPKLRQIARTHDGLQFGIVAGHVTVALKIPFSVIRIAEHTT